MSALHLLIGPLSTPTTCCVAGIVHWADLLGIVQAHDDTVTLWGAELCNICWQLQRLTSCGYVGRRRVAQNGQFLFIHKVTHARVDQVLGDHAVIVKANQGISKVEDVLS